MRDVKPEDSFLAQVLKLAELRGWKRAHFRPARTAHGWRTAVSGDGKGFPDLLLIRGRTLIVVELKVPPNRCTPEQLQWLDAFRQCGVPAFVWAPEDWPTIEEVLA